MTVANLIYRYTLPDDLGYRHLRVWEKDRTILI